MLLACTAALSPRRTKPQFQRIIKLGLLEGSYVKAQGSVSKISLVFAAHIFKQRRNS
jgi:hypothetical protein